MSNPVRKYPRRDERLPNPPPMFFTERDKQVVEAVYLYRVLTQSQIERLIFTEVHPSTAQRRLLRLYHNGYLARQFLLVRGGMMSSPILYLLDEKGAQFLTRALGYDNVLWKRANNAVGNDFLEHTLAVNEFRVLTTLACRQGGYPLLHWQTESDLKKEYDRVLVTSFGQRPRQVSVIPDSVFVIDTPRPAEKTKAYFALELDRGTETTKRFKLKVQAYLSWLDSGLYEERYGTKGLRILTVTESPVRLANLKRATEEVGGRARFWFATLDDLHAEDLLTYPMWQVAGREGLHRLFEFS